MGYDEAILPSGEVRIFCRAWRPDDGVRAVVLKIHGGGGDSGRYQPLVDYLVPRGYAVYGPDLRGHGRSSALRGHMNCWDELLGDVETAFRFAREHEPNVPCFVAGVSMGGVVALDFALRYPTGLDGVIAFSPPLGEVALPTAKRAIVRAVSRLWPTFPVRFDQDAAFMSRDPEAAKIFLNNSPFTVRFAAEFLYAIKRVQSSAADLVVPLLVLHGTADRLAHPEGSSLFVERVALADKHLRLYEGGRHCLYWDINRQAVLADVVEWLERHLLRSELRLSPAAAEGESTTPYERR